VTTTVLEATGITKSFGGVPVLRGIDLAMGPAEVVGLLGANGAGKSTLAKILCGAYEPDDGTLRIGGHDVRTGSVAAVEALGVRVIYQELSLFEDLTVYENILVRREPVRGPVRGGPVAWLDRPRMIREATELLHERLGVDLDVRSRVCDLTSGQKQLVEIARAVGAQAEVVIMDEPTTSLEVREKDALRSVIAELTAGGTAVLYISHDLDEVMEICDRVVVLRDGLVVTDRPTADLSVGSIIEAMVGERVEQRFPQVDRARGGWLLELRELGVDGAFSQVSLGVRAGEIVGVGGLSGSGKTELARAVAGEIRASAGQILRDGQPVTLRRIADGVRAGIVFVPSDRKTEGIFPDKGAAWNATIGALHDFVRGPVVDRAAENDAFADYVDRFGISTSGPLQPIGSMSGGNQQKVLLARGLLQRPIVLVMEEPTRGVDVRARSDVYRLVAEFAAEGHAVLVVSSDDDELVGLCDRVVVLHEGVARTTLDGPEKTVERVKFYSMTAA